VPKALERARTGSEAAAEEVVSELEKLHVERDLSVEDLTHDGLVPAKLLEGYRGLLLADASSVYRELYRREPGTTECGCWSHARRGAFEALSSDEPRALVIIGFVGLLYDAHMLATDPKTGITSARSSSAARRWGPTTGSMAGQSCPRPRPEVPCRPRPHPCLCSRKQRDLARSAPK
jgi:hypothetical protein